MVASLPPILLALVSGVAIAAACGLRAFLPLLLLGLAARFGLIHLRPGAEWMAGDTALWALGIAAVLEVVSDKVPVVDHALDAIGTLLRPAAAWLGSFAVLAGWGSPWAQIAALVLGAGALAVHGLKAKTRLGSTVATAGHANPVLSVLEDSGVLVLVAAAILVPLVALALVLALVWAAARWRARRAPAILAP
jgi:uncharacterized membrane protein